MKYPWDEVMTTIRRNVWIRRRRLALFTLKKSDRILDLGCGDGLDIKILRDQGYTKVTGVDVSPALIRLAKQRNPGVRFVCSSVEKLPFRDKSFDILLADSMLYHIDRNRKAFREIRRVLTPNGKLCFVEIHNSPVRNIFNKITFSPASHLFSYLRHRKYAYLAEKKAIERWNDADFLRNLDREGFRKEMLRIHFLSVVGKYRKG